MTIQEFHHRFKTEDDCKQYLKDARWPDGKVTCPRCDNANVHPVTKKPWHWQCRNCQKSGYRFSIITRTIFENTKYPLKTWFLVANLVCNAKKGISALQLQRDAFKDTSSYETVWYMVHRLRAAMENAEFNKLVGEVEVDETFVGGKEKNKHLSKRDRHNTAGKGKAVVIGAISRKGNVVAKVIETIDTATLDGFVRKTVSDRVSLIATDEQSGYRLLSPTYRHETVAHRNQEYVRGNVHTSHIDSFWSLLKRGIIGSFHKVSKEYLPLYLNEFAF